MLVMLTRGAVTESFHRGALAVVDGEGAVVLSLGDTGRPIYPRSAVKPLQALPLVETGAADEWSLGDVELALACSSHSAEGFHLKGIRDWMTKVGLLESDLGCGAHVPISDMDAAELRYKRQLPRRIHNNCSGKHAGMLTTALAKGDPLEGYLEWQHPVQQRVARVIATMSGIDLADMPVAVDGCGMPVIGLPLSALALAMARFGSGKGVKTARKRATQRLYRAMVREPFMVAGSNRWNSAAIALGDGNFVVKTGAEGVCCAVVPAVGLGMALKIDDGSARAAEALMSELLARFAGLDEVAVQKLSMLGQPQVQNAEGQVVGKTCITGF